MLNRLSDFYRIVNPSPSDTTITQRREAIEAYIQRFTDSDLLVASVDVAAFGPAVPITSSQKDAVDALSADIQDRQPSFTNDITTNALDLRVCSAIAVGEYLGLVDANADSRRVAAMLVNTALATRGPIQELHLVSLLSELVKGADNVIDGAGQQARRRPQISFPKVEGAEVPAVVKSANSALSVAEAAFNSNLKVDREELDILWWLFGATSTTLRKPFLELGLGTRAVAAAVELADLTLMPPTLASSRFLFTIVKDNPNLTIRELLHGCPDEVLQSVSSRASGDHFLQNHPALLPITWLCARRIESGVATGWESEFEHKTHIPIDEQRSLRAWAMQVFNESVASRGLAER